MHYGQSHGNGYEVSKSYGSVKSFIGYLSCQQFIFLYAERLAQCEGVIYNTCVRSANPWRAGGASRKIVTTGRQIIYLVLAGEKRCRTCVQPRPDVTAQAKAVRPGVQRSPVRKNKQSMRSLVAFLVTWSFFVLTVTGLVLYIVPQGRVAYWVHWSLAGMEKEQWGWIHMIFGGLFIVTGAVHLYFNWKPFKLYLADRVKGHLAMKREVFVATAATLVIFLLAAFNLPPASWVISLNDWVKASWVTSPELEPPFGHAEEVSLAGMARRMDLDLGQALTAMRAEGLVFESQQESLEQIARRNQTTPMAIYGIMRRYAKQPTSALRSLSPEEIEAKYAGTGLGRKSMVEICMTVGIEPASGLEKLAAQGIVAAGDETARSVAERHGLTPIDLLQRMLAPEKP